MLQMYYVCIVPSRICVMLENQRYLCIFLQISIQYTVYTLNILSLNYKNAFLEILRTYISMN